MTINIEITYSPDAGGLAAIHTACFDKGWDERAIRELLAIPGTVAFVMQDNKGFGLLRQLGDEAEILTLAVLAPYRTQGAGKMIVIAMREWTEKQGVKTLFLEVGRSNIAAQALYRKTGFETVSQRKDYYKGRDGASEDALVMRWQKRLASSPF